MTRLSALSSRSLGALGILVAITLSGCAAVRRPARATRAEEADVERAATPAPTAQIAEAAPTPPLQLLAPEATDAQPLDALVRNGGAARNVDAHGHRLRFVVDQVRFAPGSAALDSPMRGLLDELAHRLLVDGTADFIEIQGHADATGSSIGNVELALRRAEAVRSYLVRSGAIPRERTAVVSLGSGHPLGDPATPTGRAHDRSAVILILR